MAIDIQLEYLIDSPGRAANTIGIGETLTLAAVSTTPGKEIWRWSPVGNIHADHFSWNGNRAKLIALSLFEHTVELEVKNQFTNETQRIEIHVAAPGRWQLGRPTQVTHQMGSI